jgi:hypothetical protein
MILNKLEQIFRDAGLNLEEPEKKEGENLDTSEIGGSMLEILENLRDVDLYVTAQPSYFSIDGSGLPEKYLVPDDEFLDHVSYY